MTDLAPQTYAITRADLVRYAGASGDFNPIHWSDRIATGVGLPGVIAHGMLTMALAGRAVTAWVGGDPGAITDYSVRFARPVVVPDDDLGTELTVTGVVKQVGEDGIAQIDITAVCAGEKVLAQAKAWVRAAAIVATTSDRIGEAPSASPTVIRAKVAVGKSPGLPVHWSPVGPWRPLGLACPLSPAVACGRRGDLPHRGVAQLAEQRSPKPQVAGSSPVTPASAVPIG